MKVALYIEDGLEQVVLTPDSDTEKMVLAKLEDASRQVEIRRGSFYGCRGGWIRHQQAWTGGYGSGRQDDASTMIVLRVKPEEAAEDGVVGSEMVDGLADAFDKAIRASFPETERGEAARLAIIARKAIWKNTGRSQSAPPTRDPIL